MAVNWEDRVVEAGEHVVHFYEHDIQLAQTVSRYLTAAIASGGVALAISTDAHGRLLESELASAGLDPAECRHNGSLVILDAAATMSLFIDRGVVDRAGFRRVVGSIVRPLAEAGNPVLAFGEMVALLWEDGNVMAAIELEKAWNELLGELPFALVCAYRSASVQGNEHARALEEVCHLHSSVVSPPHGDNDTTDAISARFPAAGDAPRRARRFVAMTLERWGRPASLLDDAQLVVTELASNAVMHAHSSFSVELRQQAGGVRVAVRDASPARPVLRDPDPYAISGRGLRIVAALAREWGVRPDDGGKAVWAELQG